MTKFTQELHSEAPRGAVGRRCPPLERTAGRESAGCKTAGQTQKARRLAGFHVERTTVSWLKTSRTMSQDIPDGSA